MRAWATMALVCVTGPALASTIRTRTPSRVLAAALACFARNGFHATTMLDVVRASGLSAGAVYRYFPSRNALVLAATGGVLARARTITTDALAEAEPVPPDEVLRRVLDEVVRPSEEEPVGAVDLTRVAVSAWAEALRDPDLAAQARQYYGALRDDLRRVVQRWAEATVARGDGTPDDLDATAAAQVLFSSIPGFLLQRLLLGDVEVDRYVAGLRRLAPAPERPRTCPEGRPDESPGQRV